MTKISFITTINHNVGDDFIREGIEYLLSKLGLDISYQYIHKHTPITARSGFEKWRNNRLAKYIDASLPLSFTYDKIIDADFVIQSGAPVYWCHPGIKYAHCAENEWFKPLIKRRLNQSKAKFINIAAGSCQVWNSVGDELHNCKKCPDYIRDLYQQSFFTTLRDDIAKKMLNALGLNAPVLPCTSIYVSDAMQIPAQEPDFIALNFMKGGGHYSFGQKIDEQKWENEFIKFYNEISKREKCILVCHNQNELNYTKSKIPDAITFISNDYKDYIHLYSKAWFGIMNRIHGAFPIISFGRPAVIIGTDTRVKMAEVVGSKSYFVNQMNYDNLMKVYEYLTNGADNFHERFMQIKQKAEKEYLEIFKNLIKK